MSTTANNSSVPLAAGATFTGLAQLTTGFTNILISVKVDKKSELTIQQSANKVHWDLDSVWTCDPANDPFGFTIQTPVALPYFRVKLQNITAENMTTLRLVSVLNLTSNVKLTPQQDNTLISGEDDTKKKHTLLTDASGQLLVVASVAPSGTQDVSVVSRSGNGFLSYLTDNVAVVTMPAITGSVSVTSQPHLSYLTDNVAVVTMPAITGSVAVTSQPHLSYLTDNVAVVTMPAITGSVSVTSQPHLSYLTDNVAVATQPALTFSNDKVDATGSAVTISSGAITETNSGTISSTLTSLNGKVTACNTGAVVITTLPSIPTGGNVIGGVTTSHTTSSVTSWENPTYLISFDSGNVVRQIKGTAGSLHSLSIVNDNNALAFVALYDLPAAGVTPGATTPAAVFPINKNQQIQLPLHAVAFSNAISFFIATTYNGGTPLTLVYLTASYNG